MDHLGRTPEDHPGKDIRRAREELGISQAELGRRAGLGYRTVRRVEAGQGSPEGRTLAALRRALEMPPTDEPNLTQFSYMQLITELVRRHAEDVDRIAELVRQLADETDPALPTQDLQWPRVERETAPDAGHSGRSRG